MANADLKLLVGASIDESADKIQEDIKLIQKALDDNPIKCKLGVDTNAFSEEIKRQLPKISAELNKAFTESIPIHVNISSNSQNIDNIKSSLNGQLDAIQKDFIESGRQSDSFALKIDALRQSIGALSSADGVSDLKKDISALNDELGYIDISKYRNLSTTLESYRSKAKSIKFDVSGYEDLKRATELLGKIQNSDGAFGKLLKGDQIAVVKELEDVINRIQGNLRQGQAESTLDKSVASIESSITRATLRLQQFGNANKKIFSNPDLASRYAELMDEIGNSANHTAAKMQTLNADIAKFEAECRNAGATTKTLTEWLSEAYKKFGGWALVTSSMMQAVQAIKQMVNNVRDLDSAMVELKKVTDETESTYSAFFSGAANQAKQIGTTMKDYISSTADFARLGYTLDQSKKLATVASVYFNVADGIENMDDASASVISTMKAFNVEAEDAIGIVDLFNHTSNKFAISSGGIGEAMKRSASALRAAGNTMAESVAMITAANAVVQDPDKVGNAMKTLSLRIRGAKADLEDAGESTEGMAKSVSELREEVLALTDKKVDIMIDNSNFKSTYQILKEVSDVWSSMADVDQAALLELLGGKMQANVLSSLLNNFDEAEKVVAETGNATGSAMAENEKYLDSINGKINQFKVNFEALSATLVSSDLVKGVVDFGSGALNSINTLLEKIGTVPVALGAVSAAMTLIKEGGLFGTQHFEQIHSFVDSLKQARDYIVDFDASGRMSSKQQMLDIDVSKYKEAVQIFEELQSKSVGVEDSVNKAKALSQAGIDLKSSLGQVAEANDLTSESVARYAQQQQIAIQAMGEASLKSKLAAAGMNILKTAAVGVGVALASMAASGIIKFVDDLIHRQERLSESTQKLRSEYEGMQSEIASIESELKTINDKINAIGSNPLTLTEKSELDNLIAQRKELERTLEIQKQIAENKRQEASNEAVKYFENNTSYVQRDENGKVSQTNIIGQTSDQIDRLNELQGQISQAKQTLADFAKEFGVTSYQYNDQLVLIDQLEGSYESLQSSVDKNIQDITSHKESLYGDSEAVKNYTKDISDLEIKYLSLGDKIGEGFDSLITIGGFEDVDRQFKAMAASGDLTQQAIAAQEEFAQTLSNAGIEASDVVNHYNALAQAQKDAAEASKPIDVSKYEYLKTTLKDVTDVLNDFNAGDLNVDVFASGTDEQIAAWEQLRRESDQLNMSFEEFLNLLVQLGLISGDSLSGLSNDLVAANSDTEKFNETLDKFQSNLTTLSNAYKTLNEGERLSAKQVQDLMATYPQLTTELAEYLAGLRTQGQIMADLEGVYQQDTETYKAAILAKLQNSELFFQNVILANQEWVTAFAKEYGVDLNNCKTYAEAKLKIMTELGAKIEVIGNRIATVLNNGNIIDEGFATQEQISHAESLEDALEALNNISYSGISAEFDTLGASIDSTKNKAEEAANALRSIASTSLNAINGLIDMTMSMLKQDLQNEKSGIEQDLNNLKSEYDAAKKQIEADKKAALADLDAQKKALQRQKKDRDKAFDNQKKQLQKLKDEQNKIFDDRKQAAEDDLDNYNKIIDAQLKLLRLKEEQRKYEQELADKQKDVADIEAKLAEIGLDDSIEAQKKRLELEEELSQKKEELDEFQHDKNIEDQEQALEDERQAYEDKQQSIIDGIEQEKQSYNEMIQSQIDGINAEKEAFDEAMQGKLDALEDEKAAVQAAYDNQLAAMQANYDAERANLEAKKAAIEAQINDEAALRKQAIELIQGRSDEFYNRLLEWNRQYGSGIDADVITKWNNAYTALETFGGKQFDVLQVMNELTFASDGFNASLDQAIDKAGDLASALQAAVLAANMANAVPNGYDKKFQSSKRDDFIGPNPWPKGSAGKFHDGGEVGRDNNISRSDFNRFMDNLKSDEIPAILKKKEWVLTEEQQGDIMQLTREQHNVISAFDRLYRQMSVIPNTSNLPATSPTLSDSIPELPDVLSGGESGNVSIYLNTEITGNADDDVMDVWFAKNATAFQDQFARFTLNQINYKRGLRMNR